MKFEKIFKLKLSNEEKLLLHIRYYSLFFGLPENPFLGYPTYHKIGISFFLLILTFPGNLLSLTFSNRLVWRSHKNRSADKLQLAPPFEFISIYGRRFRCVLSRDLKTDQPSSPNNHQISKKWLWYYIKKGSPLKNSK